MPTLIPLDDLLGVEFIGVILSTVSTSIIRVTVAATACSRDYTLIDSLHVALLVTAYYWYTVTNFGDYTVLAADTCFFAMRVYKLHPQRDTNSATAAPPRPKTHSLRPSSPAFTISGLSAGIACDSLIAASIIYYLQIRRTIFPRTNRAINLLITYALNTCELNSRGNLREALDGRTVELVGLQSTTAMTSANSESTVRTPGGGAWGKQSSSAPAYYEMDIDGGQKDSTNYAKLKKASCRKDLNPSTDTIIMKTMQWFVNPRLANAAMSNSFPTILCFTSGCPPRWPGLTSSLEFYKGTRKCSVGQVYVTSLPGPAKTRRDGVRKIEGNQE
ncbi:hypothetical protein POSPLADRAFT_1153190 [Postia placenta MAD-698-R-SB12]|uniref:Uncharacterized protein n=1 Tax=Postia placenta MAD-698-R-SB12 TaxID=670580 RepID=A0A1X6MQH2_9APHY|nr:hypothetical protein POSPLADRAFT_1153190 [Postia placenta MAD-698-R-SB12]OSX58615.1 hypothetical protein POSPLADRAFT_1153190 [Postia placenta MAD-698-R-SB12]